MKIKLKEMKSKLYTITNIITNLSQKIEENNINYDIAKQIKSDISKMYSSFPASIIILIYQRDY